MLQAVAAFLPKIFANVFARLFCPKNLMLLVANGVGRRTVHKFGKFQLTTLALILLFKLNCKVFACRTKFGEIDPCSWIHQHVMSNFCANIISPKNFEIKL